MDMCMHCKYHPPYRLPSDLRPVHGLNGQMVLLPPLVFPDLSELELSWLIPEQDTQFIDCLKAHSNYTLQTSLINYMPVGVITSDTSGVILFRQ